MQFNYFDIRTITHDTRTITNGTQTILMNVNDTVVTTLQRYE